MSTGGSLSNSRVTKAGEVLRQWGFAAQRGELKRDEHGAIIFEDEVMQAVRVLYAYRDSFSQPTATITRKLMPLIADVAPAAQLTGRPKRYERIIDKLMRFPSMRLPQMEDVSGLRVKFPNGPSEVQRLRERILQVCPITTVVDYVTRPKPTGYRAVHMLVVEAGRTIEVQLRTARQNRWADEVEAIDDRYGFGLKDGHGPPELLRYFERAAFQLAVEESGGDVDEAFMEQFAALRQEVAHYFRSPSDPDADPSGGSRA